MDKLQRLLKWEESVPQAIVRLRCERSKALEFALSTSPLVREIERDLRTLDRYCH